MSTAVATRCTSITKRGTPCRNKPVRGRDVCKQHTGDENVGRPSKFTSDRKQKILQALEVGAKRKDAAKYAGITERLLTRWIECAHQEDAAGIVEGDYVEFLLEMELAEARCTIGALAKIRQAAQDDAQWAAWMLDRRGYTKETQATVLHEYAGHVEIEHMLGERQPVDVPLNTREKILALIEEESVDATAEELP